MKATYDDDVLIDVVSAFVRSIRAMGYYDPSHPVFEATRREAHGALQSAFRTLPMVTLGCGGHHLLIDEDGGTLNDPPSVALAHRMFENAVVALRLHPGVRAEDLGLLMQVLAEREDRVRAAGGVSAVLERRGTTGIEVLEVDIDALFSGRQGDLQSFAEDDPVANLALKAMLRFRDQEQNPMGEALQVSLSQVGSAGSLGNFLDELMGQAEPGVVADQPGGGGLTGDDLADLASQAFLRSHDSLKQAGQSTAEIAQSAELLSNALVRLSPDARFALLRKLAGGDEASDEQEAAIQDLGKHIDDRQVTSAIAAALFDQRGDPATVRAIGNLIRRIRPVEAERHRLLSDVDNDMRAQGRPIDGVLWQEMQSRAFENNALGLLEMSLHQTRQSLREYALARRSDQVAPVAGQDVLHTVDSRVIDYWTTYALADLLEVPSDPQESGFDVRPDAPTGPLPAGSQMPTGSLPVGANMPTGPLAPTGSHASTGSFGRMVRLGPGAIEACRLQLERLDQTGATDECMLLLQAMMRRSDVESESELSEVLIGLLESPEGPKWSRRLLRHEGRPTQMMGEILLNALDRPGDRTFKSNLIDRLARFDREGLIRLTARFGPNASPLQAQSLVLAALRLEAAVGVRIARMLLRNPTLRVREVVLKTVVERPDREVVALLAHVAGWKGEKFTKSLLGADVADSRSTLHRIQLAAVGALGLTRNGLAAKPLLDILVRSKIFNDRDQEELRVAAAMALRTNATAEAQLALREASQHRKRVIRETVQRVMGRGGVG